MTVGRTKWRRICKTVQNSAPLYTKGRQGSGLVINVPVCDQTSTLSPVTDLTKLTKERTEIVFNICSSNDASA